MTKNKENRKKLREAIKEELRTGQLSIQWRCAHEAVVDDHRLQDLVQDREGTLEKIANSQCPACAKFLAGEVIKKIVPEALETFLTSGSILDVKGRSFLLEAFRSYRYEEQVEDSGYDVSFTPLQTNRRHNSSDYTLIGDFLLEPTGNTLATFVPGSGLRCETWSDSLCDWARRQVFEWYERRLTEEGFQEDSFEEVWEHPLFEEGDNPWIAELWEERFSQAPFSTIFEELA